jgi:O-antigen/teichoic acid export membrane protein
VRTLTRVGVQISTLVNQPLFPEFSVAYARNNLRAQGKIILFILAFSALILVSVDSILILYGVPIVEIWTLVYVLTIVMTLHGLWTPPSNLILAMNQHHRYTYAYLLFSASSIIVSYILARSYGAFGAGVSLLFLELAMFILVSMLVARLIISPLDLIRLAPATWSDLVGRFFGLVRRAK